MRVIQLLLGALLWYVGTWTNGQSVVFFEASNTFYSTYLIPSKPWVQFLLYFSIFSLELVNYFLNRSSTKNTTKKILDNIVKTRFENEYESVRITIFKVRWGISCIFSKIKSDLLHNITGKNHVKKRTYPHPFRQYLWIYTRVGQPNETDSQAHFLLPTSKKEINGACSKSAYAKQTVYVNVEKLNLEELGQYSDPKQISNRTLRSKVEKTIKVSFLDSLESLKKLNRFSTEVWATPIVKKGKIWGVIAFDYDGKIAQLKQKETELVYDSKTIDNLLG